MNLRWDRLLKPCPDPFKLFSRQGENLWLQYLNELFDRRLMLVDGEPGAFSRAELQSLLEDPLSVTRARAEHASSSCILFLEGCQKVAMVHHRRRKEWFYPGGHADGNWNWFGGSIKECVEETGVKDLVALLRPTDLTQHFVLPTFIVKHFVSGGPSFESHAHLDFVYLFETRTQELQFRASESLDARWFDLQKLASEDRSSAGISTATQRIFERAQQHLLKDLLSPGCFLRQQIPAQYLKCFTDLTVQDGVASLPAGRAGS